METLRLRNPVLQNLDQELILYCSYWDPLRQHTWGPSSFLFDINPAIDSMRGQHQTIQDLSIERFRSSPGRQRFKTGNMNPDSGDLNFSKALQTGKKRLRFGIGVDISDLLLSSVRSTFAPSIPSPALDTESGRTAVLRTNSSQTKIHRVEFPGELPVYSGMSPL